MQPGKYAWSTPKPRSTSIGARKFLQQTSAKVRVKRIKTVMGKRPELFRKLLSKE
jgi:hypothetical protein